MPLKTIGGALLAHYFQGRLALTMDEDICDCDCGAPGCMDCIPTWGQTLTSYVSGIANNTCSECTELLSTTAISLNLIDGSSCFWYTEDSWVCGGIYEMSLWVKHDEVDKTKCYVEIEMFIWGQAMQPDEYIYWISELFDEGNPPEPVVLAYDSDRSTSSTCNFTETTVTVYGGAP